MRYIGNKENVVPRIDEILPRKHVVGENLFDFFAGTTSVGKYYKRLGYRVESSDFMYFSYCLQKAYIENNTVPRFERLLPELRIAPLDFFVTPLEQVIAYLNTLDPEQGFIYTHYTPRGTANLPQPRMYFSDENGGKIDAIRRQIELWREAGMLLESEYYILLASLIESVSFYANVAGVYAAFYKKWDPRAIKPLMLRPIEILVNNRENRAYHADSMTLLEQIDTDILYLDPPYNERQYAPNYHVLETIARNDNPEIRGVTGMRNYTTQRSRFCKATSALDDLDRIACEATYRYLVLSYNSEGIMSSEKIVEVLSRYGDVEMEQFEYLRFKSNNNGLASTKRHIWEQLYILRRR